MAQREIKKEVLKVGKWFYDGAPNGVLNFTEDYLKGLANNFAKSPFAPVLRSHIDLPTAERNPELIVSKNINKLQFEDNSLYAYFTADEAELDTYPDVSVQIASDMEDHKTGEVIGDVIEHIALTLNPYIKGLKPFQKLSEKSAKYLISLSEIKMDEKTKEVETTETVTEETTEKVEETEAKAGVDTTDKSETTEEVAGETTEEVATEAAESSGELRTQLSEKIKENEALQAKLNKADAEAGFDKLLKEGKVLPSFKTEFITLSEALSSAKHVIQLSDGNTKSAAVMLSELFSKMPALVNLSEKGIDTEAGKSPSVGISAALTEKMRDGFKVQKPNGTETEFLEYLKANEEIIKQFDTK